MCIFIAHSWHVETVVLLSKGAKDPVDLCSARTEVERRLVDSRKVKVDFSLEDMDLSEFKGKATYEQIKAYVLEQTGLKVSISHRLRRSVDWMSVRISIWLNQRIRDSHSVQRRRKRRLCRRLVILESNRLWISSIVC